MALERNHAGWWGEWWWWWGACSRLGGDGRGACGFEEERPVEGEVEEGEGGGGV